MMLHGITVTGVSLAKIPPRINTNETIYMIRHAEAHPSSGWDDGNFVGAGQWRALALPNALRGKISPTQVYPGSYITAGNSNFSYVRPSLTVEPYAIANNLPFNLVYQLEIFDPNSPQNTSDFFFNPVEFSKISNQTVQFSNQTVLLAWEHEHFQPIITKLLASYFLGGDGPTAPAWPDSDFDTIWTVTLDSKGNLTVNNALCEGIDSMKLPVTAPQF